MITKEMKEAIEYLSDKDNYMVFAGFATFLQTGIECSNDIDIYLESKEDLDRISQDFISSGWKKAKESTDNKYYWHICLKKNDTTLDLVYAVSTADTCKPFKQKFKRNGIELYTISTETLFLEKLNQVSGLHRTPEKTKRDREAIAILRKMIDINKIQKLVPELKDIFWREGYL